MYLASRLFVCLDTKFGLHVINLLALAVVVKRLLHLRLLIVKHDQISIAHVEA